ncbi:type II toxin-antitoxin system RelE/ParE family toxin [Hansschlegelia zhihuaiae]|uniref:type II toxin-antitoxin system RelE/ParE family toxin n=1 Tax=Hansschlegelia zhihuaiae TaxID=405005 RepID=UPI001FDF0870|nr:type II toxin-antitoxin system RelE/ParE family toxin [Hansschlegelia zhihuaiae]
MRDIRIETVARDDLDRIFAWIADENPAAAERVLDRIDKTIRGLADFSTGRPGRLPGTFEEIVPGLPYIVIYATETARRP